MSAQLCTPDRFPFAPGEWFRGIPAEYEAEGSTFIAYTGPFHIDEPPPPLTHTMFISLFPNWIGQTQLRIVKIEGDFLNLITASPIPSAGKMANSYLRRKRTLAD